MTPRRTSRLSSHPSGPMAAASFPTSVFATLPAVTKLRLVQMIMLFLHRVSMTFVLRTLFKNPTRWERTRETMMWSSSFPAGNRQINPSAFQNLLALERVYVKALVFPRKTCQFELPFDRSPLCIVRGDNPILPALLIV